jgi:hypothetical protein
MNERINIDKEEVKHGNGIKWNRNTFKFEANQANHEKGGNILKYTI